MMSLAICEYVHINTSSKKFYLFDTFDGIPEDQMSENERSLRTLNHAHYANNYEVAVANFSPFPNARFVRGKVPKSLAYVDIDRVCYLSIDMNIAHPERKAIEHFWPRLSPGAAVVLDDYGWLGYEEQRDAMRTFAQTVDVEILTLPTGQGLILKP